MHQIHRWVAAAVVASPPTLAQTVWPVANGADLTPTIAAAAPGDILALAQQHPHFVLNKGLTLIGDGTVIQDVVPPLQSTMTTIAPPTGQQAHLIGLTFRPSSSIAAVVGGSVAVQGTTTFENCHFRVESPGLAALTTTGATVAMTHCTAHATYGGGAVVVAGGVVSMTECEVSGGHVATNIPTARPGIEVQGGTLLAHRTNATGGDGGYHMIWPNLIGPAAPALTHTASSTLRLTDCMLTAGGLYNPVLPGADAIAGTSSDVLVARTTLVDTGSQTVSSGYTVEPELIALRITQPLILGTTTYLVGIPGSGGLLFGTVATFDLGVTSVPALDGALFGAVGSHVTLRVVVPTSQVPVMRSVTVPPQPALTGQAFWFQSFALLPSTVRCSGVVGGVVR